MRRSRQLMVALPLFMVLCTAQAIILVLASRPNDAGLYYAIAFGVLGLLCLVMLIIFILRIVQRAGQSLDPILAEMGLSAEPHLAVGRRYRGEYAGRDIEVEFIPAQWNRRALLNVHVMAAAGTRIAFFRQGPPLDCADCPAVSLDAQDLADLSVRAENPDRAREVLDDWDFRTTLAHLFAAGARDVYVQPDRIWLRTRAYQIGAAQLREWIDGLVTLADRAEREADGLAR